MYHSSFILLDPRQWRDDDVLRSEVSNCELVSTTDILFPTETADQNNKCYIIIYRRLIYGSGRRSFVQLL